MKDHSLFTCKRKNKGTVLIEFGFAVPIMIMVLYAIVDLSKYYLRRFQMENACKYAANMVQTISQARSDKQITAEDIERIFHAAFLGVSVGESSKKKYMTIKHVRGEEYTPPVTEDHSAPNGDTIQVITTPAASNVIITYDYSKNNIGENFSGVPLSATALGFSNGPTKPTAEIYKNLPPIKENEERIILELGMLNSSPGLLGIFFGSPPILGANSVVPSGYVTIGSVITFAPEDTPAGKLFIGAPEGTTEETP
ncbi:hypothetical protein FACS1894122_03100 [Alphaproteobacteria bacterium]|nr:hypothetical protein FACS1894122_03100 [Alphaproteobacteria bacterium]